jgi:hypothetical protein
MKLWQYRVIQLVNHESDEAVINSAGKEGYKLISIINNGGVSHAYMMREWVDPNPRPLPKPLPPKGPLTKGEKAALR